ncbi:MAG: MBL fold metallo-hydrolase [Alphaproteobacteria bacterium]|nr:MBL fold metallo-hydrolase [Alphaproteobacteria bacterium]
MNHRNCAFTFAIIAGLTGFGVLAQAQAPNPPLTVKKVKNNIYFVEGGGGNSGVIIGQNGVIVIDTKTTAAAGKGIVDAVAKLTNKPITTVILTHSDADHVNGLVSFPKGVTIIADQNDRKEMEAALAAGARGAPPSEFLPNKIVTEARENDTIDGVKLTLIHVAPAHTSGDLAIYLPDEKLVFSGDLIGGNDPLIHRQKNGTSEGWIEFVSALVQLDANTYVLGHADPETRAPVEAHLKHAEEKRAKIAAMVKDGKSLEEIKAAFGETVQPGANAPRFPSFTETTYQELTKK